MIEDYRCPLLRQRLLTGRWPTIGVVLIVGVVGFLNRQSQELMAGLGVLVGAPAPQNGLRLPHLCRRSLMARWVVAAG